MERKGGREGDKENSGPARRFMYSRGDAEVVINNGNYLGFAS